MQIYKGVVLAAGVGSRLRPLTEHVPKPLLPFCGIPMFYLALARLNRIAVAEIAANAHYHYEKIIQAAADNPFDRKIHVSVEKEVLLGSAGVYGNLQSWRQGTPLVVLNGDVVSSYDLTRLLDVHESCGAWASLGLVKGRNPHGNSIWVDPSGTVRGVSIDPPADHQGVTPHIFSGFQVLSHEFLKDIQPNRPSDLVERFRDGLNRGKLIKGLYQNCFWHDLGTPDGYFDAHRDFLNRLVENSISPEHDDSGYFDAVNKMGLSVHVVLAQQNLGATSIEAPSLFLGQVQVGEGCTIGPYVFATPGTAFPPGAALSYAVILDNDLFAVHRQLQRGFISHNGLITRVHV